MCDLGKKNNNPTEKIYVNYNFYLLSCEIKTIRQQIRQMSCCHNLVSLTNIKCLVQ